MWIRLHKELRELALPWAAAVAVAAVVAALGQVQIALLVFAGLCFYLTVRPFGGEFDRGTLPRLLSQPIPRPRIWGEKMLAATAAVALGYGVLLLLLGGPGQPTPLLPLWLILLVAIATGPTMSLVLRDSLQSFWAALALPAAVLLAAAAVWSLLLGGSEPPAVGAVLLPYCAVMALWGHRRFLALEVTAAAAPRGRRQAVATTPRSLGPARELVLKELRLQRSSLLPVPVALAAFVPVWWYFRADPRLAAGDTLGEVLYGVGVLAAVMLTLVVPALIGAHAVALERQLGVLGWHLGLPVSRRLQWRLKLACCLLLTLAVGSFLGSALSRFLFSLLDEAALAPTFVLVLAPVAAMACGLYGSRLAGSPFRALGFGLILALVVAYVWKLLETTLWLAAYVPYRWRPPADGTWLVGLRPLYHPAWTSGPSWLDLLVGLTLLALILPTPRQESWLFVRRRFGPAAFAALLALAVAAFSQIYVLNLIAVELDRQIAANDDELASAGGADLVAALAASLDQSLQHFAADLEPIYSYGAQVFYQYSATQYFETLFGMRRPPSTSMKLVALLDGAGAGPSRLRWQDSGGVGFWFRDFYRELDAVRYSHDPHLQFAPVGTTVRYSHDRHFQFAPAIEFEPLNVNVALGTMDRDTVTALRPYSLAPLWSHQHRRGQFDLLVRQNLTLDALDMVRYLAHSPAVDRDHLRRLLEATPLVGVDLEPVDRAGLHNLGYVYWHLGERRRAIELFERAIVIARETGDRQGEGAALIELARVYMILREPHRAIEPYQQAIAIAREMGDRWGEALRSWKLGEYWIDVEPDRAGFEQEIAIAREIGDRRGEAIVSWDLGLIYEESGELERAVELMEVRVAFEREIGHPDAEKHAAEVEEIRARIGPRSGGE